MSDTRWIPTSAEVYRAIYDAHRAEFRVFGTHTCQGCPLDHLPTAMTEWGFKDADYPLVKSEGVGEFDDRHWSYWIAAPVRERGGE